MSSKQLLAIGMVVAVLLAGVAPVTAAGSSGDSTSAANVSVTYAGDQVVVTYNTTSDATLTIDAVNGTYAGEGTYNVSGNGSLALPVPNDTVTLDVTLTVGNQSWSRTVTVPPQNTQGDVQPTLAVSIYDDGDHATVSYQAGTNATLTVDAPNASYAGEGTYNVSGDGSMTLPAPNESVTVTATLTGGNDSTSTTATLSAQQSTETHPSMGQQIAAYIHSLLDGEFQGGVGQFVSSFAHGHNRGQTKADHGASAQEHGNASAHADGHGNASARSEDHQQARDQEHDHAQANASMNATANGGDGSVSVGASGSAEHGHDHHSKTDGEQDSMIGTAVNVASDLGIQLG